MSNVTQRAALRMIAMTLCAALGLTVTTAARADTAPSPAASETTPKASVADLQTDWVQVQRDRIDAEKQLRDAQRTASKLRETVKRNADAAAAADMLVSEYARALYRSGPGSDLAVVTNVVDAPHPEDAFHAASLAEQVGDNRSDDLRAAQELLAANDELLQRAEAAEDAAAAALKAIQQQVDNLRRSLSDGVAAWITASGGGSLSAGQASANRNAAKAWSAYLTKLSDWKVPSVTINDLAAKKAPAGVKRSAANPGVGQWSSGKRSTVVLPDRTIASVTYAVSLLGTPYQWRSNSPEGMDCAALLTRSWDAPFLPKGKRSGKLNNPSGGVRGLAARTTVLPASKLAPGDWVFIEHPGRGVNHAGIAITPRLMIAADPTVGAVAARPIPQGKVWRVGRPSAPDQRAVRVPAPTKKAFQCGSDPRATRGLGPVPTAKDCPASPIFAEARMQPTAILAGRCAARLWPELPVIGGWRPSDPYPDHPSGRALDLMLPDGCSMEPANAGIGDAMATFFMRNAKALKVQYIIWEQRIWNAETENPKPLNDWRMMGSRGSCTANHIDHVHVSFIGPNTAPPA